MKLHLLGLSLLMLVVFGCGSHTEKPPIVSGPGTPAVTAPAPTPPPKILEDMSISELENFLNSLKAEIRKFNTAAATLQTDTEKVLKAKQDARWQLWVRVISSLVSVALLVIAGLLIYFFGFKMWKWAASLIAFAVLGWGFWWFVAALIPHLTVIGAVVSSLIVLAIIITGLVVLYRKYVLHKELSLSLSKTLDDVEGKFPGIKDAKILSLLKSFADNDYAGSKEADKLREEATSSTSPAKS